MTPGTHPGQAVPTAQRCERLPGGGPMAGRRRWRSGTKLAFLVAGLTLSSAARAQGPAGPTQVNPYYAAPGNYGMAWGSASYGLKRTYSEFSSPYGPGYAYGYAPYGLLPGRYGVGLWRPGYTESA